MDSGKARSHRDEGGPPTFRRKVGITAYLLCKYADSPRPSATPLINAGGKKKPYQQTEAPRVYGEPNQISSFSDTFWPHRGGGSR